MNPPILMRIPCTFCGAIVLRFPSQQINQATGQVRKVVKCKNCRKVDPVKLFWMLVKKEGNLNGCWIWIGAKVQDYGQFASMPDLGEYRAHRISWVLHTCRPIPEGMKVLHKVECHNRSCVNPDHLYLGNSSQNTFDMMSNGTHPSFACRGETHYNARLTEEAVRDIKRNYGYGKAKGLADKYGVAVATIQGIGQGYSWAHVKV